MNQTDAPMLFRAKSVSDDIAHWYNCERNNEYNLSFWFPKIQNCGIKVPETDVYQVPADVFEAFFLEKAGDRELIRNFVTDTIIPHMSQPLYFMKNGCFSNKFNFQVCMTNSRKIVDDIIAINEAALCVESGGCTEIILREPIPYYSWETPCIYHGMPLQTEIRTFYDFDKREVLYSANYWDYDTVRPHLRDMTDIIIFDSMKDKILAGYEEWRSKVEVLVTEHMINVDLTGKWSIDLLVDFNGQVWLIDMAKAARSTYWKGGLFSD
jgi:hypothetical protein